MSDFTRLIDAAAAGDPHAAAELLPLVYDELRKLAAQKLVQEKPGQTLQATALVHEAYVRLVGGEEPQDWSGRGHFFAAAAEAMRCILIEAARRKGRPKGLHGGRSSTSFVCALGSWTVQSVQPSIAGHAGHQEAAGPRMLWKARRPVLPELGHCPNGAYEVHRA